MNLFDIPVPYVDGHEATLDKYKGQVLLIVNTASGCGLTPQFKGLEELYESYHQQGFSVLGFPCNQFANQEPLSASEAQTHCQINYGVQFPMFGKLDVNGKNAHPLYVFLKSQAKGLLTDDIKWNFTKFLIDKNGTVIKRFSPKTEPEQIRSEIEKLLS